MSSALAHGPQENRNAATKTQRKMNQHKTSPPRSPFCGHFTLAYDLIYIGVNTWIEVPNSFRSISFLRTVHRDERRDCNWWMLFLERRCYSAAKEIPYGN